MLAWGCFCLKICMGMGLMAFLFVCEIIYLHALTITPLELSTETLWCQRASTELIVLPHCVICAYWRLVLGVWDWHICWVCVNWDVSVHGCALLQKGFASHSSPQPSLLLVHGTCTDMCFLHPPQLSSPICTPRGRCDPSGAQPQVVSHTFPRHPTPHAHPQRGCCSQSTALC